MTDSVAIDLVICTYNNASLLDQTLAAISRQDVPPHVKWNVLVVANNCTDETLAVVDRHVQRGKMPSLSWVEEPRQGLTYARLCGVRNTTAPWIAFVDDDCLLRENWVAQAARFAQQHPNCGGFGGKVVLDWVAPPPAVVLKYTYAFAEQDHGAAVRPITYLTGAGLVLRRAALQASGWTEEQFLNDRVGRRLLSGGDMEITLRIHGAGYTLWYNPACTLKHRIPPRRTSVQYLIDINYGLGISQLLVDALRWPGAYPAWLPASTFRALRSSAGVLRQAAKALIRRGSIPEEVAINWSFVQGRWAGIRKMLRMAPRKRRALLGCAKDPQKR